MSLQTEDQPPFWLPASPSRPAASVAPTTPGAAATNWLVEFRVGSRSLPYLADHGFHDIVVLPGAFHIELVRRIHRELFQKDAVSLRHIEFEKAVILANDDLTITVRVGNHEDGRVSYELFEATGEAVRHSPTSPPSARMQVDLESAPASNNKAPEILNPDEFLGRAVPNTTGDDFYKQLRESGNQYGPHFQTLAGIWQLGPQAAALFAEAALTVTHYSGVLSPPLLDAASQLLSSFTLDRGRTFIVKSIEHLVIHSVNRTGPLWALASRTDSDESLQAGTVGTVQVRDATGTCLWEFSGLALAFIVPPVAADVRRRSDQTSAPKTRLCVAATFTAEPLEDSLHFWAAHFSRNIRVDFAPYNQVFQQLLDPTSAFRSNPDGINLIVLGLEDWLHDDRRALSTDPARASACFGGRTRHTLPNGIEIVHLNRYETEYVYHEIFEDESYLRHGIELPDGATVIDIGANIGLFSLFVMSCCKNPAIIACEPSPRVFDLLRANCAAYGDPAHIRVLNCGVAEARGSARFTFYEHSSVFSSFHPDEHEDRAAVQAVVRNVLQNELHDSTALQDADIAELTANRLRAESIECPLISVSDIIRENGITRIHLLKIDAEKSELGILRGIEEAHWPLIEQIVMEIHDHTHAAVDSIEQQLTHRGFHCAVVEEKLLERSGLFNIYATRRAPAAATVSDTVDGLQRKVDEFSTALDTFAAASTAPLILAVAPRSTADATLDAAEQQVLTRAARHAHVHCLASRNILARHPVREFHDAHSHQLGHMPFTQEGYAALGTALFRAIFNLSAPPVKVIVLDCDNTLWQGLCAEDGPAGIVITPAFRRLQEFMLAQMHAGVLLALCSKNQEADVLAVFEQRTDMPLHREHLAGWRINWESKPENLRALAAQFNLGLDSFVFLDDNPVECAAVRVGCPEVIVLQLPQQHERIPSFLDSLWIFDRATATREDRERSQWYRANSEREELRTAAPTLRDFLDGLQLRIEVTEATVEQLPRVAQLTLRTNQFNLTSIRRTEGEIRALLKSGAKCLVTTVSDRFGDYGLVGAILATAGVDRCTVDTLLLSCRALGKGVEHRMVAELARRALRDGQSIIELPYRRTERNEPARSFLSQLGSLPPGSDFTLELSAAKLAELRYEPGERAAKVRHESTEKAKLPASGFNRANLSSAMQRLGDELSTIKAIVAAMESSRLSVEPQSGPDETELSGDASALERSLAAIWRKALGRTRIGFTENFFEAGGTSLKAVVVVAMIRKELKKNVSIISLFESPTIKLLAAKLDCTASPAGAEPASTTSAESRGRQRRNKLVKRRAA